MMEKKKNKPKDLCFNPCFNGMRELNWIDYTLFEDQFLVSILVLME